MSALNGKPKLLKKALVSEKQYSKISKELNPIIFFMIVLKKLLYIYFVILAFLTLESTGKTSKTAKIPVYSPPKSSIVIDLTQKMKVISADNPDAKRNPASLAKLMTVYLLFEALKARKISLSSKFKVSKFATSQPPSKLGLKVGEKITVADIVKALLVKSANDIAVVAAEGLSGSVSKFVQQMNKKARQLGMSHSHFENPSGLPNKQQVTTARDIATLGIALFKQFPQYWYFFKLKNFPYKKTNHDTHCTILKWYKGADGAKTGFIYTSGFNLFVSAEKYNKEGQSKRLFVVVFGGTSAKARDFYAARLLDANFGDFKIAVDNLQNTKKTATKKSTPKKAPPKKSPIEKIIEKKEKESPIENVLDEEEEITIEKILDYSMDERRRIEELYIEDEQPINSSEDFKQIIDEISINDN